MKEDMQEVKVLKEFGSWIFYIAVAIVIASLLNVFVFQITRVSGSSMVPTLQNGDLYVISKLNHLTGYEPKEGDVIVIDSRTDRIRSLKDDFSDIVKYNALTTFVSHSADDVYWVKRVIGTPGDVLTLQGSNVYKNGTLLSEDYVNPAEKPAYSEVTVTVPEGYIWVMGDNRNHSSDSRVIGLVPIENVIGKLKFKIKSGS